MRLNRTLIDITRDRGGYLVRVRCNVDGSHCSVLEETYSDLNWPEVEQVLEGELEWRRPGYEVDEALRWVQIPLERL